MQRFYDEELSAAECVQAEQLLEGSASARVFVAALGELSLAVQASHELVWERAEPKIISAARLAELAAEAGDMMDTPLEDLRGLLQRLHDDEVDPAEEAWARALLGERPDAAAYLASLGELGEGLRIAEAEMVQEVDFSGFWDKISAGINTESAHNSPQPAGDQKIQKFDAQQHLMLLHRFADAETDAAETAQVQAWIDQDEAQVCGYLEALDEIKLGVNVAAETACENAPLDAIWGGVFDAINAEEPSPAPISLEAERQKRGGFTGWAGEYRQAIFGAAAAALVAFGVMALFGDRILGPKERVIVEKTVEKHIVIVDSVEYSPGSSVMIDSPMTRVNMNSENNAEADPTVIWLFDSEEETEPEPQENLGSTPADDSNGTVTNPDAEAPTEQGTPRGQPI
ncbi:hypothetical protein DN745_19020 [Bradymonas sediminis]|uniref:Uncharacterized protein n=1 Tax=Bradymonas sediminis TaxID=1548548 RepID=A0A2Z4FQE5_9DELT|nr:hypothetical protein DN745_19020 [Bradymonas sediminis]